MKVNNDKKRLIKILNKKGISFYKPKYLKKAVWSNSVDWTKTLLVDVSKNGLEIFPVSDDVIPKLILFEHTQTYLDTSNQEGKKEFFNRFKIPLNEIWNYKDISEYPIIKSLKENNIDVVLTPAAWSRIDSFKKEIKRFITPFKFEIPDEFKDLQIDGSDTAVKGPFIEDIYSDEIRRNKKKLYDLGLLEPQPDRDFYLYEFQAHDAARLAVKRFAYLGHEMGLGKTAQAIAVALIHNYQYNLIIAPSAAIGSFSSGWRHEIHRMGVAKDHIHVINDPEDIPTHRDCKKKYKNDGKPHFFLVDYTTLSKEKLKYNSFYCPKCHNHIPEENKGRCKNPVHQSRYVYRKTTWGTRVRYFNPNFIENFNKLTYCPVCAHNEYLKNGQRELTNEEINNLKKDWTGNSCKACGFKAKERLLAKGRAKKGYTETKPIWKCIPRGLFKCIFVDESHMIKNISSKRSQAVQMLRGANRIYIITGTMMTNYVEDTFWQLQRLCPAGIFPVDGDLKDYFSYHVGTSNAHKSKEGYNKFINHYQGRDLIKGSASKGKLTTIKNPESFWNMLSCFMVRRKSTDDSVNKSIKLPPTHFHTEFIEMDKKHKLVYKSKTGEFQKDIYNTIRQSGGDVSNLNKSNLGIVSEADMKQRLQQIRQICVCPDLETIYTEEATTKDLRMMEIIQENKKNNNKTVIFCVYNDHIQRLKKLFEKNNIETMVIDGRSNKGQKWKNIDTWRTTKDHWVLISTINVLGTAVNLTPLSDDFECATIIFGTPDWIPSNMYQAWKRVSRIGQRVDVNVYYLWHKDSIEKDMDDLLQAKMKVINQAIDRLEHEREGDVIEINARTIAQRVLNKNNSEKDDNDE